MKTISMNKRPFVKRALSVVLSLMCLQGSSTSVRAFADNASLWKSSMPDDRNEAEIEVAFFSSDFCEGDDDWELYHENERCIVTAYDSNGTKLWDYETTPGSNALGTYEYDRGLGVWQDRYYLVENGILTALDLDTGDLLWRARPAFWTGCINPDTGSVYMFSKWEADFIEIDKDGNVIKIIERLDRGDNFIDIETPTLDVAENKVRIWEYSNMCLQVDLDDYSCRRVENIQNPHWNRLMCHRAYGDDLKRANCVITPSSSASEHPSEYLFDGDPATFWTADSHENGVGQSIGITLEEPIPLKDLVLFLRPAGDYENRNYSRPRVIEIALDNGETCTACLGESGSEYRLTFIHTGYNEEENPKNLELVGALKVTIKDVWPGEFFEETAVSEIGICLKEQLR